MEIPQKIFDMYYETVDDFIDLNFGVNCTLFYGPKKNICPNCIFNPVTGKSSNQYKAGGPISFQDSICPYCDGDGYTNTEAIEDIKLRVYFSKKDWVKIEIPVLIKDGAVQIIGHITDMPKIRKARQVRVCAELEGYENFDFTLAGAPSPWGFRRNKYFVAFMNRVQ